MTEAKKTTAKKTATTKKFDRLGKTESWTYTDKNGKDWKYEFQFPGIRKTYEMLDNAKMSNGNLSKSVLYDEYLANVVVSPAGLTLDDFDERPGVEELFDKLDNFLGSRLD